ncbi:hypothetical protein ACKWTF_001356 [Chironomus riparius]
METIENITLDCENGVPNVFEFFTGLNFIHKWILVMPTGFYLMTITLFILNLCTIIKYGQKETKSNVLILVTLYPIVATTSMVSIFMPRTYFFCDTIAHIVFVITSYQFYRYCINCIEGESKFIAVSKGESFTLKAPPCCCCCLCLKTSSITKEKFLWLRILVLQMAIVHVIIFSFINILNVENPSVVEEIMLYCTPFLVVTILLAVWGFQITIRLLVPYYSNLNLLKKFLAFQLVLVFCKFQPVLLNLIMKQFEWSCEGSATVIIKIRSKY